MKSAFWPPSLRGMKFVLTNKSRGYGRRFTLIILLLVSALLISYPSLPTARAVSDSKLVQQQESDCGYNSSSGCKTLSLPFYYPVKTGDVVVVSFFINSGGSVITLTSITDSLGSSFTQVIYASSTFIHIYYAVPSKSGKETITLTFSANAPGLTGYIYEVSGVAAPPVTTSLFCPDKDQGSSCTFSSLSPSTSPTTFQSGAFLLGSIFNVSCMPSISGYNYLYGIVAGPHFTLSSPGPNQGCLYEEYSASPGSSVSSPTTFPLTLPAADSAWLEVGLVFNPPCGTLC